MRTNGSTLFILLDTLSKRLDEKNVLHILVLITKLVEEQYNVYVEETGVKVKPPLFQYFLEEKEGAFSYNQHCEAIVNKCFNALSDEEFCLHLVSGIFFLFFVVFNSFFLFACDCKTFSFNFRNG